MAGWALTFDRSALESCCDHFGIDGVDYSGVPALPFTSPLRSVVPGTPSALSFRSDLSVQNLGVRTSALVATSGSGGGNKLYPLGLNTGADGVLLYANDNAYRLQYDQGRLRPVRDRFHDQVDADCGDDDLGFVFDDLARVRDAIVGSAVATARGDKTKADQRAYETRVLGQHRTDVCRWVATAQLSSACAAHFRYCASPAGPVP